MAEFRLARPDIPRSRPGVAAGHHGGSSTAVGHLPARAQRRVVRLLCALLALVAADDAPQASGRPLDGLAEDVKPDKKTDAWTTSSRFKQDLVEIFGRGVLESKSRHETVLELGAHVGHCTRVLSRLFGSVIAVEHSEAVLDMNVERTSDLSNVVHLRFHTVMDSWDVFARGRISVVFIDAAHDYHSVRSDLEQAIALPWVHTIILDDYGAERGVKSAVSDVVAAGLATVRRYIGEAPPWQFSGRVVEEWEGIVLDPVRSALPRSSAGTVFAPPPLENTTWIVFPAGVFVSGYFQPHGRIHFNAGGVAGSSYGTMSWRAEAPDIYIVRLEDPPGWRAEMHMNPRHTAAVLFRHDEHELVMLRQEMMRTVGEKLLSFMH